MKIDQIGNLQRVLEKAEELETQIKYCDSALEIVNNPAKSKGVVISLSVRTGGFRGHSQTITFKKEDSEGLFDPKDGVKIIQDVRDRLVQELENLTPETVIPDPDTDRKKPLKKSKKYSDEDDEIDPDELDEEDEEDEEDDS